MKTQNIFTIITITNSIFYFFILKKEHVFRNSSFLDFFQDIPEIHVIIRTNYNAINSDTHKCIIIENQFYGGGEDNNLSVE